MAQVRQLPPLTDAQTRRRAWVAAVLDFVRYASLSPLLQPPLTACTDMEKDDEYDELYDEEEGDDNDFNLGICLPPPVARLYTTKELHGARSDFSRAAGRAETNHRFIELIHQGIIDLNPPYQRGMRVALEDELVLNPSRGRLARSETNKAVRLPVAQLLPSTHRVCGV